jgi:hypothetical protein
MEKPGTDGTFSNNVSERGNVPSVPYFPRYFLKQDYLLQLSPTVLHDGGASR